MAGSSSENDDAQNKLGKLNTKKQTSPFGRRHFPRDSGCYEGSPLPPAQNLPLNDTADDANSLDSVVTQCSNEIMKRVESARRMLQDETQKGLARVTRKGLLGGSRNDEICTRGGALSEKSSDSGVSSSSLSSGPAKNNL